MGRKEGRKKVPRISGQERRKKFLRISVQEGRKEEEC